MTRRKHPGLYVHKGHWWIEFYLKGRRRRYSSGVRADLWDRNAPNGAYRRGEPKPPPARVLAMIPEGAEQKTALVAARRPVPVYKADPTLKGFAAYYLALNPDFADLRVRKILIGHLVARFPGADLADLTWLDIERWQKGMTAAGLAPRTINQRISYASTMFRRALKESALPDVRPLLAKNPCEFVRALSVQRRDVIVSEAEEAALVQGAAPWLKPLIPFAVQTGAREGEICALRREWVRWEEGDHGIVRLPAGETKGTRIQVRRGGGVIEDETLNLTAGAAAILRAQPLAHHGFIFSDAGNASLHEGGVQKAFAAARAVAGLPGVHFHDLRHTGATRLALAGATVWDLLRWGRWKDIRMAQRYVDIHATQVTRSAVISA